MATYILTTGISGNSGIAKAVLETANLIAQIDKVYIVTVIKNFDGFAFSTPSINIEMNKNIEIISLKNKKIKYETGFTDKFKVELVAKEPLFKAGFNSYDYEVFRQFAASITEKDNVIFASFFVSRAFAEAGAKFPCKTIGQVHANFKDDVFNRNNLLASLEIIDKIQVIASDMVPYLSKITGLSTEDFIYISNVVNPKSDKRGISGNGPIRVGIIGSYQKRKNQLFAIKIFKQLQNFPIELQMFGGTNGKYFELCEKYIEQNNISNVKIMGVKSEAEIFENIDIVFAASTNEGQNLTLLEGMAYGKPLISTDFKYGPFDMVVHGENGLILKTKSARRAAKKILKFCDIDNREVLENMSKASANLFDEKFKANKLLEKYESILKNVGDVDHFNPFLYNKELQVLKKIEFEETKNYIEVSLTNDSKNIKCREKDINQFVFNDDKTKFRIDKTKQHKNLNFYVYENDVQEYLFTYDNKNSIVINFYYTSQMIDLATVNVERISKFEDFIGITFPLNKVPKKVISSNEKIIFNIRSFQKDNYYIPFIYLEDIYEEVEIIYYDGSNEKININ